MNGGWHRVILKNFWPSAIEWKVLSCQLESLFREMLDIAQYGEYTCIFYIQTKQAEQILQNFHVKPFRNQGFSYSHVLLHFRLSTLLSDNHPAGPSQDYILPRNH